MVGSGDFQKAWHTFHEALSVSTKQNKLSRKMLLTVCSRGNYWHYYYSFLDHFKYCKYTNMLHYSPCAYFDVLNTKFSLNMGLFLWVFFKYSFTSNRHLGLMYCPSPYKIAKSRVYCFTVCSQQEQMLAFNCHMSTLALWMTKPQGADLLSAEGQG